MVLIGAIKPKGRKEIRIRVGESEAYIIKSVFFLYALGSLAAIKTLFKRNGKFFFFYT